MLLVVCFCKPNHNIEIISSLIYVIGPNDGLYMAEKLVKTKKFFRLYLDPPFFKGADGVSDKCQ